MCYFSSLKHPNCGFRQNHKVVERYDIHTPTHLTVYRKNNTNRMMTWRVFFFATLLAVTRSYQASTTILGSATSPWWDDEHSLQHPRRSLYEIAIHDKTKSMILSKHSSQPVKDPPPLAGNVGASSLQVAIYTSTLPIMTRLAKRTKPASRKKFWTRRKIRTALCKSLVLCIGWMAMLLVMIYCVGWPWLFLI